MISCHGSGTTAVVEALKALLQVSKCLLKRFGGLFFLSQVLKTLVASWLNDATNNMSQ
jgi:hypothetical protein